MMERKAAGERIDSKDIRKHKNDVFRLMQLINPAEKVMAPKGVCEDMREFVDRMKDENVDIKQLNLPGMTKEHILEELKNLYMPK